MEVNRPPAMFMGTRAARREPLPTPEEIMPGVELWNKRFFPADDFGHGRAQPCLSKDCPNVLLIDHLEEGDIWSCARCSAKHEFYAEYISGPGGRLKYGVVRLLEGEHIRTSGEPTIVEFLDKP